MRDAEYYENLVREILDGEGDLSLDDDDVQDAFDDFVKRLMEIDGGAPNPYIIEGLGSTGEDEDEDGEYEDDDGEGEGEGGGEDDDGGEGPPPESSESEGSVKDDGDSPPSGDFGDGEKGEKKKKKDSGDGTVSDSRMKRKASQYPGEGFSQRNIAAALRDLRF